MMPSGISLPSAQQDRRIGHQVADIAHQHQRAALEAQQLDRPAPVKSRSGLRRRVKVLPPLATSSVKVALHQAEPVAIDQHLVFGIDGSDGILAVHDRGQRRFEHDVGRCRPDRPCRCADAVDDDFGVQAVLDQQNGRRLRCLRTACPANCAGSARPVRPAAVRDLRALPSATASPVTSAHVRAVERRAFVEEMRAPRR